MNKVIYVIDDDQDLRETIVEILEGNDFKVHSFDSAESALKKIKLIPPSVVTLDNMMPGMDGMAFIPILKQQCPHVKIIMITAFSTVDNAVAAMKLGVDDYLAKPFKREELLVAIGRSLEELRFEQQMTGPNMDDALSCLSNEIRRNILTTLASKGGMRFMDITRELQISDHTKVNFHLKNLKTNNLVSSKKENKYNLTPQGEKMVEYLSLLSKKISH